MKTNVILIIAIFFTVSLRSQTLSSPSSQGSLSVVKQKLDSVLISSWDSAGAQWKIGSKTDYAYDTPGNLILSYSYSWTSSTKQWRARSKFECVYDFLGLLSYTLSSSPDTTPGGWRPSTKHEYLYNPKKSIASDIQLNWNADSAGLAYSSKYDYTYNLQGRLTSEQGSIVNSKNEWQPLSQVYYTYNGSGNLTVETAFVYRSNHQWEPAYKNDHSYDSTGNRILTIYSQPDTGAASWKYISKNEFVYNDSSKMILQTDYQFSAADSVWNNQSKEERNYNDSGDMWYKYDYTWDQVLSQWVPLSDGKIVCDYNVAFNKSQLILPPGFENYNSNHLMMDKFQYRWNGSQWNNAVQNDYYYSEKNLGIPENSLVYCRVYPNPARDYVCIDWPGLKGELQLSIFNQNGLMVFSAALSNQSTVGLSMLQAGEYILKITGNQKTTATKLIIQ